MNIINTYNEYLAKLYLKYLFIIIGIFSSLTFILNILEEIKELIEDVETNNNKIHEAADVFYHLIMYLEANDIKIEEVMSELRNRKK